VQDVVDDAVKHGARLLAGGKRMARKGYFFEPTVLADVPNSARAMNDEPFGPVALLNPFRDLDGVLEEANRLPFGLAAFGFTNDSRRVNLLGERIEAGMIGLNSFQISMPESPFGGVKESGHGSEEGIEGLEACLVTKFISVS
jgi:succinate-semialdehyde dehydrogenase/glutarate-semialdehyde dehydrogenase